MACEWLVSKPHTQT